MLCFVLRLPKYGANSYFTSIQKLPNATEEFHKKFNSSTYFTLLKVPVGIQEVKDLLGTCFNLVTNEIASLDTRFQGKVSQSIHSIRILKRRINFRLVDWVEPYVWIQCLHLLSWTKLSNLFFTFHSPISNNTAKEYSFCEIFSSEVHQNQKKRFTR